MDRSSGTISPTSPSHLNDVSLPTSPKSPPPRPPPPKIKSPLRQQPPVVNRDLKAVEDTDSIQEAKEEEGDSPFQRRNAKRGLKFTPRSPEKGQNLTALNSSMQDQSDVSPVHSSSYRKISGNSVAEEPPLKHTKVSMLSTAEDETLRRTPSPYSCQSSPGGSPYTSPSITPRSSRYTFTLYVSSHVLQDTDCGYHFEMNALNQWTTSCMYLYIRNIHVEWLLHFSCISVG